jgi:hypothetical protein
MPLAVKADSNFIERFFLSDKAYAKHIEVKAYILTDRQSADLLANPTKDPIQLVGSELSKSRKKHLVIRVRNLGNKHTWGILACSVPGIWETLKIPVISIQADFCDYLICIDGAGVAFSHDTIAPKVTFKWDQLYTK